MIFDFTDHARRDLRAVGRRGHVDQLMLVILNKLLPAAEASVKDPSNAWPAGLRVKGVQGHPGIFEFTWSKKDPDGRATFEWGAESGVPLIRIRRVGDHSIFKSP